MSEARIHDRGYRGYEGERLGVTSSMRSLWVHGVQRVLGLKRPLRMKVLPAVTIGIAYIPAIVFVGLAAFLNQDLLEEEILPEYWEYYGTITFAIVLFCAFVAPEVLCTDRRTGMLSLYLASPLTRDTYLASKAAAVMTVLLTVTLGPPLLLLIAYTFEGAGPGGIDDFLVLLVRMLAAGVWLSAVFAALSLAISSTTSRKAFASAAIILVLLVTNVVVNVLTSEIDGPDLPNWLGVFDLIGLPFELTVRIFGETQPDAENAASRMDTEPVVLANLAWVTLFAGYTRWRYQTIEVEQ